MIKSTDKKKTALPQPGEIIEFEVSALDEEGYGIGVLTDVQVKVSGALPGEKVRAKVIHTGKHRITASRTRIIAPAASRITSPCKHSDKCDSCPLIEMNYQAQLNWKESLLQNHVKQYKPLSRTAILPVIPSPRQLGYRNSAKLVVGGKYAAPLIGIYKRNSHDILDIGDCQLHHPLINRIAAVVRKGIIKGRVPVYSPKSKQGLLRYLVIRVAEQENRAMVVLVTARRSFNELHHLAVYLRKEVPEVMVITQNVNSSTGNVILGTSDHPLTKETSLQATLDGIKFLVSPRSFFQINSGSAAIIYNLVRKYSGLDGTGNVLDLYCGTGAISLFLKDQATALLGIEVVDAAVADAWLNARLNRAANCTFEAGDVLEQLQAVIDGNVTIDLAVLNPPRKGCEEPVLLQLALLRPRRIIYVSCSPQSLARDLCVLHKHGYHTDLIQPVDMFPQTPHIESVAVLNPSL
jgi:23S rRNA (uracil1939-C5)-methyltransferase